MTEKYKLVCESGDYHIAKNNDILCYDLCSPTMAKENWNNVVSELNRLNGENKQLKEDNRILRLENEKLLVANANIREENNLLKNIIDCLEKGSCRSIDSFLDDYCSDELLKEFGLDD